MKQYSRRELIGYFQNKITQGEPIIASGAGAGIIASIGEKAGLDLLIVYSTGLFRMSGAPLMTTMLPYGQCNDIVSELAPRILCRTEKVPVIGAIGAADPFVDWDIRIDEMLDQGFSGMINYPVFTGVHEFAEMLEENGIGITKNAALIKKCRERNFFSCSFAFDREQARKMAASGADMICAMAGGTAGGSGAIKERYIPSMDETCALIQEVYDAALSENPDVIVMCHGGPVTGPGDLQKCMDQTDVKGFIGGSSIERIPIERAIYNITREFVEL